MFIEKVKKTKLGRFDLTLDSQNIAFGFEVDWSEPFSIDIYLPFVKLGWQMNYVEEEPELKEWYMPFVEHKEMKLGDTPKFIIRDK